MFGGTFSILHWIVVLAVVLLLFGGRGKVSAIMGDFGKGLRNFKTGLKGSEEIVDAEVIEEAPKTAPKKAAAKKTASKKKAVAKRATTKKASAKKATKK
jgi:sec-independent protein translocase protein TatA